MKEVSRGAKKATVEVGDEKRVFGACPDLALGSSENQKFLNFYEASAARRQHPWSSCIFDVFVPLINILLRVIAHKRTNCPKRF